MNWIQSHKIASLVIALIVLIVGNAVIFVPKYIADRQQLDTEELEEAQSQVVQAAEMAAEVSGSAAEHPPSQSELATQLSDSQKEVDEVILLLQTTKHEVAIDEQVRETLRLAQVLSFTIRSYSLENPPTRLNATKTTQVLEQSVESAKQLKAKTDQL